MVEGVHNVEISLLIWVYVDMWYLGFSIAEELLDILQTCAGGGTSVGKG